MSKTSLKELIGRGLNPEPRINEHGNFMATMYGCKLLNGTPIGHEDLANISGYTPSFPFPQVYLSKSGERFVLEEGRISKDDVILRPYSAESRVACLPISFTDPQWVWGTGWSLVGKSAVADASSTTLSYPICPDPGRVVFVSISVVMDDDNAGSLGIYFSDNYSRYKEITRTGNYYFFMPVGPDEPTALVFKANGRLRCEIKSLTMEILLKHTIGGGTQWHVAEDDFGHIIMTNGTSTLVYYEGMLIASPMSVRTVGYLGGRLWLGGFKFLNYVYLDAKINNWRGYTQNSFGPFYDDTILVTTAGSSDVINWLFYMTWDADTFYDLLSANDFLIMRLPECGKIIACSPMNGAMVFHGERGICNVSLTSGTPSRQNLLPHGILGRGCVAGNGQRQLFLDYQYALWSLTSEGLSRLGYDSILNGNSSETVISMNEYTGDFYITDLDSCFLLNASGLTRLPERIISCMVDWTSKQVVGFSVSESDTSMTLKTEILGRENEAKKTITDVMLVPYDAEATVQINHRLDSYSDLTEGDIVYPDADGLYRFDVTCQEFELEIVFPTYAERSVSDIIINTADDVKYRLGRA